jgi:hypothetical protein
VLAAAFASTQAQQTQAQQTRDRQLTLAYDLSKIQMPVEIVSIKVNGKDVRPG